MITDGEKWHPLAVQSFSRLVHGITSKHKDEHYCMNCHYSFRTESKFKPRRNVCKNYIYCNVKMPETRNKILMFNQDQQSVKIPFAISADKEWLL